jgi:hypothetical protein
VEDLDALEDKVAVAAEAAATAAAHAVAAAKAAEEISKAREQAETGVAHVETSGTDPEPSREATDPNAELPEDSATEPDVVAPDSDAETEPTVSASSDSARSDQTFDDLLSLDAPDVAMPTVLARIALMALGAAAAIFLVSIVLVSTLPKGTSFDVVILVAWLAVGALSIGGFALLTAAGIAKVTRSADRA